MIGQAISRMLSPVITGLLTVSEMALYQIGYFAILHPLATTVIMATMATVGVVMYATNPQFREDFVAAGGNPAQEAITAVTEVRTALKRVSSYD